MNKKRSKRIKAALHCWGSNYACAKHLRMSQKRLRRIIFRYLIREKEEGDDVADAGAVFSTGRIDYYRIVDDPTTLRLKRWRPYKDTAELIKDFDSRFPSLASRPDGAMPIIWLRRSESQDVAKVTDFFDACCSLSNSLTAKYADLFNRWEYLDGSPFGVKIG